MSFDPSGGVFKRPVPTYISQSSRAGPTRRLEEANDAHTFICSSPPGPAVWCDVAVFKSAT